MKKIITLSLVAATLLFTGCGEDSKKAASEATTKAVESTKEAANSAVDATKAAADKAVEATKEVADKAVDAAKESTAKVVEATKEGVATATEAVADTANNVAGAAAYAKCAGCHGADGKTKALGKSPVIAGQSKEDLVSKIKGYKAGTRNEAGMGNLMKGQVASMDDATIDTVATYISTLK